MAADAGGVRRPAIDIEIVWVEADGSIGRRAIELPAGSRVRDALASLSSDERGAALLDALARAQLAVAIYGERCDESTALHGGDRVELLAGLVADPKLARRRRAQKRRGSE